MSQTDRVLRLLEQIFANTTPSTITMISATSTNPEFHVNFPTAIPAREIALAQLRIYYSWPNTRAKSFRGLQANNSLVFAYKNKPDGTPDWNVVSIRTGGYQIEQIKDEFQRRIKSITGKGSKIAITAHEPTLSAALEISTPDYAVDLYQSSIRTVLGWPEVPPPTRQHENNLSDLIMSQTSKRIGQELQIIIGVFRCGEQYELIPTWH